MSLLANTIKAIQPVAADTTHEIKQHLSSVMEGDNNTLGELERLLLRTIAITGERHPQLKKCTIICCGDHGVAAEGVSAYPPETTLQMVKNYLISRGAAANALANYCDSALMVVDMGINADTSDIPNLINARIASGTQNIAQGPAMTHKQAIQAIETGISLAEKAFAQGFNCLLPGEMGIANTTSSAAICAVCCKLAPEKVTGYGTNISSKRLQKKISIVKKALTVNQPDATDGIDILAKVGGFELGAITGLILAAAAHKKIILLDGANTGAAALIAQTFSPIVTDYILASHLASEKSHQFTLQKLGLKPIMKLDFRLGEACGSSILAKMLEKTLAMWSVLDALPQVKAETPFQHKYMTTTTTKISDKTFDFYLKTMQDLDKESMELCQQRLDNLAKPIYSLGFLEQIAVETAGIIGDELPPNDIQRTLLCFTGQNSNNLQEQLIAAWQGKDSQNVTLAHVRSSLSLTTAFDFGRNQGEYLSLTSPLLGLAITEPDENTPFGTTTSELSKALLNSDNSLKYPADEFLRYAPSAYQPLIGALIGAIIAAAHNSSFIVLDDKATDIIARYTELLCPAVRPYILHVQPKLLQTNITMPSGLIASLGFELIDASLHILNDMRTFAETKVATATDGPGALRQFAK